ncbi:MAG TPA: MBL fold metallo-hydrolase [Dehalococcoidia bacterium]|nr:MBL fold metallo-hydrolase [Dehalococcoidia bacterium]
MEITWLGHAAFRIRAKEATLLTDPCDRSTGYSMGRPTADIVTISVPDAAHSYAEGVAGNPRVIDGPGEFEISHVSIVGITTWRGKEKQPESGRNVAYVFELEDVRLGHLGAIGHVPTPDQVEEMTNVDVLFVPVGGGDSLDAPPAAETVSLIEPKLVIPMHFRTEWEKEKLDPVDRFLKEMGAKATEAQAKVAINRGSLPSETQVLVLDVKR